MKVYLPQQPHPLMSRTRGVGTYAHELTSALRTSYPEDQFHSSPIKTGYDLIHYPFFDPFFLTLPIKRKAPTVVTVHDAIPLKFSAHFPPGLRGLLKFKLQKRTLHSVEAVITDSEASRRDLIEYLGVNPDKLSVIPLAPALDRSTKTIEGRIRQEYQLPPRFVLYVGDINWNKNVVGLVQAFGELKDRRTHLVLVGKVFSDQPNIKEYRQFTKAVDHSGKKNLIHQLGYVPQHHLPLLYRLATLYVQPSWYEGFGLPVLEAMHQGCPVLSSNRGSLPEVGGRAVAYFDPGKKGELVNELNALLASAPERTKLKQKGLVHAKLFSWARTARATYELYQAVLS